MAAEKKKAGREERALTEDELYRYLLIEDETFKDEGREDYVDEVIEKIRGELGTDRKEKVPDKERKQ